MERVDERTWKAICQVAIDYDQVNWVDGLDGVREYYQDGEVVARMRVAGSETDKPGYECQRTFEAVQGLIEASKKHYIPTEEEWAEWDELDGTEDREWLKARGLM